jgi:hypothetical protein
MHDRSLAEATLIECMDMYIERGHRNEKQLAQMCRDLIRMTGAQPAVKQYIDRKAVEALDEASPWG